MKRSGLPTAPTGLTSPSRKLWKQYVEEWDFSLGELELLELLCRQNDRLLEARKEIDEHGIIIEDARGSKKSNPACRIEQHATQVIIKLARVLGLLEREEPGRLPLAQVRKGA